MIYLIFIVFSYGNWAYILLSMNGFNIVDNLSHLRQQFSKVYILRLSWVNFSLKMSQFCSLFGTKVKDYNFASEQNLVFFTTKLPLIRHF